MDAILSKLRLTPPAVKLLKENGIKDFAALVGSNGALQLLREHLNPIQQSKLNAFTEEFNLRQDEKECDNENTIQAGSELKATRQEQAMEELKMQPAKNRHHTCREPKRAVVEPPADDSPNTTTTTSTTTSTSPTHSYDTRTAGKLDLKPDVPLQPASTAATPTQPCQTIKTNKARANAKNGGDCANVCTADQLQQQHITREWRESLLLQLSTLCCQFAQCNYDCEFLHLSRLEWRGVGAGLELDSMGRSPAKTENAISRERRQHEAVDVNLRIKERRLWDAAYAAENHLLDWNRQAMRLNLFLAVNPHVEQALWLQAVDLNIDHSGYITVMLLHSRQVLVRPGVDRLFSLDELGAVHAQYE